MGKKILIGLILTLLSVGLMTKSEAAIVSTGDLGITGVSDSAGNVEVELNAVTPSNSFSATLDIKFGLYNSPDVDVNVYFNGSLAGNFVANQAYFPNPQYITFDVTGMLIDGLNLISFSKGSSSEGDYIIGQVDLTYSSVPIPSTIILLGIGVLGISRFSRKEGISNLR